MTYTFFYKKWLYKEILKSGLQSQAARGIYIIFTKVMQAKIYKPIR